MAEIVSPSVVVDLKWRDEPLSPTQILERIHMVLVSIDDRNETSVQLASSRSPKVVKHGHMEGSETDSYLRVRSTVTRRGSTEKMIQWLAYFALVGMELMKIQDSQRPQKFRHFEYLAATRRQLSKAMIRQMIFNWAVTLELHPCSLGILTETTGVVVVPLGLRIDCQICENPLIRSNEPLTLRAGRRPIPERVVKLEMNNGKKNQPRTKIRAVIVTEHRNTNTDLGGYTEQSKDVIIILVSNFIHPRLVSHFSVSTD